MTEDQLNWNDPKDYPKPHRSIIIKLKHGTICYGYFIKDINKFVKGVNIYKTKCTKTTLDIDIIEGWKYI